MRAARFFENPIFMSASPFTDGLKKIERCFSWGAGGVFTKTIWIGGRPSIEEERIIVRDREVYNTTTYSGYDSALWLKWLEILARRGRCVIPNILGRNPEEMVRYAKHLERLGMDLIELGISCPNDGEILSDRQAAAFLKKIHSETKLEVSVKLAADAALLRRLDQLAEAGIRCVTISDALPGYCIKDGKGFYAGYSGAGIKPLVLRKIVEVRRKFPELLIFGAGGIQTAGDVEDYLSAGADYVQLCSVGYTRGIAGIRNILKEREENL